MPNYNTMLTELQEEFKRVMAERESLDQRIAALMKAMDAVKLLAEEVDAPIMQPPPLPDEAGFTEKVRNLLRANPAHSFTAIQIRDVLLEFEPKADQKILLIHTHNTLKRLYKQKEVEEVAGEGRTAYRWKPNNAAFYTTLGELAKTATPLSSLAEFLASDGRTSNEASPSEKAKGKK